MKIGEIKEAMGKYKRAWENQDSKLILECFNKDGVYQESPLSKPYNGHSEIRAFWDKTIKQETRNIKFKLGKCYVSDDGKTGFAEWECENEYLGKKGKMVGIMILKMSNGKIDYLNEYWNTAS